MEDPPIDYRSELSELKQETALLTQALGQNNVMTKELLDIVKGTNSEGLVTKTALNTASIKRAWWWLSALSVMLLGVAGWIIRGRMS